MPHPAPLGIQRPLLPTALLVALTLRILPALILPQTAFQPDEFWQSLEPAHVLAFGYGHLTWEWKDLPVALTRGEGGDGWYERMVVAGRMRGWIWPGVFALIYKGMTALGVEERFLTLAPRLVGSLIAAFTDYATYLLGIKLLGPGAGPAAMFLSLTSLFHAHILPRALSTSPETLLTALALLYFPLPGPEVPSALSVGEESVSASKSEAGGNKAGVLRLKEVKEMDYVMMDRMSPQLEMSHLPQASLAMSAALASLAVCIRPTTIPFWAYLGLEHIIRTFRNQGVQQAVFDVARAILPAGAVFAASTGIDFAVAGRLYFPILTFVHYNLFSGLSATYGSTSPLYHLTQSLPIMLFPIWYWFAQGFSSCLLPSRLLPTSLSNLDRPSCLRTLARALTFAIATLSLSPHSEWRFLHPFLPSLLLFALPPLFKAYAPVQGVANVRSIFRQYLRITKRPFYLILLAPVVLYLYLNIFHGRAQVEVMNALRRGEVGEVKGLVVLMPCHSTPWMSHLHRDVPAWFLTCEPPIGRDAGQYHTQQSIFYNAPVSYLSTVFPYPPSPLHKIFSADEMDGTVLPSHVVLFGSLLDVREGDLGVAQALEVRGYSQAWSMWNGFDWAQDEEGRKGGVRIWTLSGSGGAL